MNDKYGCNKRRPHSALGNDKAAAAGKVSKIDKDILNFMNELFNRTSEVLYNYTNRIQEEEKDNRK